MSLDQDVAAARGAVDALEHACTQVARHYRDTVDARRLRVDIARLREDLTLLCGAPRVHPYDPPSAGAGWDDGFDESIFDLDSAAPGRSAR
jgi:hypothetical protein